MKVTNTAEFNLKTFQSKLEEIAFESLGASQCGKNLPLDVLALSLATSLVEIINANSKFFKPYLSHFAASEIFETVRKLVLCLIAENGIRYGHPFESIDFTALVDAYECLLDQRLSVTPGACSIVSSANEKRRRGVFYTPDELARELTTMALRPLVLTDSDCSADGCEIPAYAGSVVSVEKLLTLKIVDPAMGAGTFLLMALDVLTDCIAKKLEIENCESDWSSLCSRANEANVFGGTVKELRALRVEELHRIILRAVARNCLYGLDLDVAAVQLARIGLARKCQIAFSETQFPNLRSGNALIGLWSNPDDSLVSEALKKLANAGLFLQSTSRKAADLSEAERRNMVCLQFFTSLILSGGAGMSCERLSETVKAFHWNLDFEEVFSGDNPGFDLVLTNPPWEIEKANSREFFTRYDAEYMSLSKQAALVRQEQLISQCKTIQEEWNVYLAYHEGLSEFLQRSAGLLDPTVDTMPPFSFQGGSDANSYKLFLELGYHLLKTNGAMAQIVPSGIYSDKGAAELRRLFLDRCRWDFLNGYHNREGIFSIHRSFKFCTLGVIKGGITEKIKCRFSKISPKSREKPIDYHVSTIKQLSPETLAFTEFPEQSDVALIQRLGASRCHAVIKRQS